MKSTKQRMNRVRAMLMTALLAGVMVLATACGGETPAEGASGYVKSFMDLITRGEIDDYVKYSGETEEEAQEEYDSMTATMLDTMGSAGVPEDIQNRFVDVYKGILEKSRYTIGEAEETGDDKFKVDIVIEPVTGIYEGLSEEIAVEGAAYIKEKQDKGETVDINEAQQWAFTVMLDKIEERAKHISYGEPKTITVNVKKDGKYYGFDGDKDYGDEVGREIGETIIDISSMEQQD